MQAQHWSLSLRGLLLFIHSRDTLIMAPTKFTEVTLQLNSIPTDEQLLATLKDIDMSKSIGVVVLHTPKPLSSIVFPNGVRQVATSKPTERCYGI